MNRAMGYSKIRIPKETSSDGRAESEVNSLIASPSLGVIWQNKVIEHCLDFRDTTIAL